MREHKVDISVLIPVFNKENYIKETLTTVNKQITRGRFKFEVIIVDDKSSDNSLSLIRSFEWDNEDILRIKILENSENHGAGYSFNRAFDISKGDFIAPLDADDLLTKLSLLNRFEALKNNHEYDWVCGNSIKMSIDGTILPASEFLNEHFVKERDQNILLNKILAGNQYLPAQNWLVKKDKLGKSPWFSDLRSSQDTALAINLLLKGLRLLKIDAYVSIYRNYTKENHGLGLYVTSMKSGRKLIDFEIIKSKIYHKLNKDNKKAFDERIERLKNNNPFSIEEV